MKTAKSEEKLLFLKDKKLNQLKLKKYNKVKETLNKGNDSKGILDQRIKSMKKQNLHIRNSSTGPFLSEPNNNVYLFSIKKNIIDCNLEF